MMHTPGPWIATCDDESTEEANAIYAGKIRIARVEGDDEIRRRNYPGDVEPIGCSASIDALDEVDANARLIAAAPELLAACERAAAYSRLIAEACEAAIAKAKGGDGGKSAITA